MRAAKAVFTAGAGRTGNRERLALPNRGVRNGGLTCIKPGERNAGMAGILFLLAPVKTAGTGEIQNIFWQY